MDLKLKYKSNIDWDYILNVNNFSNNKIKMTNKKKFDFDFENKSKFILKKPKKNYNYILKSKKSINSIYYGILFIFFFCFLFFLSISIGFAATKNNKNSADDMIYDENRSNKLLEDYILNDENNIILNEENEKPDNKILKNNSIKKIEYQKYRIKKNDTLIKIAKKFGLSIDTIILINNIFKNNDLKVGKLLIIPNQDGRIITVKSNDSIYKISDRYAVKWEKIVDVNNIDSHLIIPGTKLFIPDSKMNKYEKESYYGINFIWPVNGSLSSYYGSRKDPFTGVYCFHPGIDIKGKVGKKIKSVKDGKIIFTGWNNIYGNFIIIKHKNNYITSYAHLSEINVKLNQYIKQGEYIGKMGSTGRSTGPHLHFEIRKNGKLINPLIYLE